MGIDIYLSNDIIDFSDDFGLTFGQQINQNEQKGKGFNKVLFNIDLRMDLPYSASFFAFWFEFNNQSSKIYVSLTVRTCAV